MYGWKGDALKNQNFSKRESNVTVENVACFIEKATCQAQEKKRPWGASNYSNINSIGYNVAVIVKIICSV
jgi:hypothetical protein